MSRAGSHYGCSRPERCDPGGRTWWNVSKHAPRRGFGWPGGTAEEDEWNVSVRLSQSLHRDLPPQPPSYSLPLFFLNNRTNIMTNQHGAAVLPPRWSKCASAAFPGSCCLRVGAQHSRTIKQQETCQKTSSGRRWQEVLRGMPIKPL